MVAVSFYIREGCSLLDHCSAQLLCSWVSRRVIQTDSKHIILAQIGGTFSWEAWLLILKSLKNLFLGKLTTFINE